LSSFYKYYLNLKNISIFFKKSLDFLPDAFLGPISFKIAQKYYCPVEMDSCQDISDPKDIYLILRADGIVNFMMCANFIIFL